MNQFKIRKNRKKVYKRIQAKAAMILLAPSMIGVSIFILIPFVDTILRSFMISKLKTIPIYLILGILASSVVWPLWFMLTQSIASQDELLRTIGPVFGQANTQAFLPILPSWPTLQPIFEILLDSPEFLQYFGIPVN